MCLCGSLLDTIYLIFFVLVMLPRPARSTLFPYTTLFRSGKLDLALPLHAQALKLQQAKLGTDHRDTLDSMVDLGDRKSTRLNSSHVEISYAVFCLKKKKTQSRRLPQTGRPRIAATPHRAN